MRADTVFNAEAQYEGEEALTMTRKVWFAGQFSRRKPRPMGRDLNQPAKRAALRGASPATKAPATKVKRRG
jgi:hypothetical protein